MNEYDYVKLYISHDKVDSIRENLHSQFGYYLADCKRFSFFDQTGLGPIILVGKCQKAKIKLYTRMNSLSTLRVLKSFEI